MQSGVEGGNLSTERIKITANINERILSILFCIPMSAAGVLSR
jgi:hypothetical protein